MSEAVEAPEEKESADGDQWKSAGDGSQKAARGVREWSGDQDTVTL